MVRAAANPAGPAPEIAIALRELLVILPGAYNSQLPVLCSLLLSRVSATNCFVRSDTHSSQSQKSVRVLLINVIARRTADCDHLAPYLQMSTCVLEVDCFAANDANAIVKYFLNPDLIFIHFVNLTADDLRNEKAGCSINNSMLLCSIPYASAFPLKSPMDAPQDSP